MTPDLAGDYPENSAVSSQMPLDLCPAADCSYLVSVTPSGPQQVLQGPGREHKRRRPDGLNKLSKVPGHSAVEPMFVLRLSDFTHGFRLSCWKNDMMKGK